MQAGQFSAKVGATGPIDEIAHFHVVEFGTDFGGAGGIGAGLGNGLGRRFISKSGGALLGHGPDHAKAVSEVLAVEGFAKADAPALEFIAAVIGPGFRHDFGACHHFEFPHKQKMSIRTPRVFTCIRQHFLFKENQ